MKKIMLAVASAVALACAGHAAASINVGDILDVQYHFPSLGTVYSDSGPFAYTGPGQTIGTQDGISTVILDGNHVVFSESPGCGEGCTQSNASWNGPVVFDLTNLTAFSGWTVWSDTVGITGSFISGGEIGVNWQGAPVLGDVVVGAPEPAAWALMLVGFAGLGAGVRARRKTAA